MVWYVYVIKNSITKRKYVGMSKHIDARFIDHLKRMKIGEHHQLACIDYSKYGKESFAQKILCKSVSKKVALYKEQVFIKKIRPEYNKPIRNISYKTEDKPYKQYGTDWVRTELIVNSVFDAFFKKSSEKDVTLFKKIINSHGRKFAFDDDSKKWHTLY